MNVTRGCSNLRIKIIRVWKVCKGGIITMFLNSHYQSTDVITSSRVVRAHWTDHSSQYPVTHLLDSQWRRPSMFQTQRNDKEI